MKRINQAQLAYEKIRQLILANELMPNERLKESFWAEKLNVNRADIRQAFARLHGEGLLVSGKKGGFFVRSYTEQEIKEIYELRAILEISAARLVIKRATDSDLQQIKDICNLMVALAENGFVFGFYEADLRFHTAFIKAAHNSCLEKVYANANLPLTFSKNFTQPSDKILIENAREHMQIFEAILKKDLQTLSHLLAKSLTSELFP